MVLLVIDKTHAEHRVRDIGNSQLRGRGRGCRQRCLWQKAWSRQGARHSARMERECVSDTLRIAIRLTREDNLLVWDVRVGIIRIAVITLRTD